MAKTTSKTKRKSTPSAARSRTTKKKVKPKVATRKRAKATKHKAAKPRAAKKTTKKAATKKVTKKKTGKKTSTKKKVAKKTAARPKARATTRSTKRDVKTATPAPTTKRSRAASRTRPAPARPKSTPRGSGLSARDIEQFRMLLLEKRAQLCGDVDALQNQAFGSAEQAGESSRMPLHMADLGSDNFEHEFTLGLIEGERAVLNEIDEAIERISQGTYGICLATGQPIGKARLRAKPWAKYCYEYTLAQERGQEHGT
ncbi:MAG: TraR/DksA C4-type zinc finger protein [Phycisphaerae bacterium]|nr:TraR/DksA C4-type zinc finger protein [Phycisphaerae bacterium]